MPVVAYLAFYSFYWFSTVLFGTFYRFKSTGKKSNREISDIVFLLPAYKPNKIFFDALNAIKIASGGRKNIKIFILFQEADKEIIKKTELLGYHYQEKSFKGLSGNSYHHALQYAVSEIRNLDHMGEWAPSHLVLLDKDNIIAPDFIDEMEKCFLMGYDVVQGRRLPFDSNTKEQIFDSISESLNDFMFRASKSFFGLTLEISGSGVGFKFDVFEDAVRYLDKKAPGMDKNLMVGLLSRGVSSVFNPAMTLHEEKTDDLQVLHAQRVRWLGVQYYIALTYGLKLLITGLKKRQWSPIDYVISLMRPPRSVQVLLVPLLALIEILIYIINDKFIYLVPILSISTVLLVLGVGIFMIASGFMPLFVRVAMSLPKFALSNLAASIKGIQKENQGKFIHTEHKKGTAID